MKAFDLAGARVAATLPGGSVSFWIQGLRANNRYNVRLRGRDQERPSPLPVSSYGTCAY